MIGKRKEIALLGFVFLVVSCSSPPRGVIILCAGDSLTDSEYPRHLGRLLGRQERPSRVLNFGRKGHTSGEYLRFLRSQRATLAAHHPDFILLQLGTNDARADGDFTAAADFERNLEAVIAVFQEFTNRRGEPARVFLATIPPLPDNWAAPFGPRSRERVVAEINPAIRRTAEERRLVLVDNFSLFSRHPELLPSVHPSPDGYRRLAENWYDALEPLLGTK